MTRAYRPALRLLLAIAATANAACMIGPKYTTPSAPVPPEYKELQASGGTSPWKAAQPGDAADRGPWWAGFNDSLLNDLEERVQVNNQSVAAAAANVQVARALVRQARAQFFPAVTTNPGVTSARIATGFGQTLGVTYTAYAWPVEATWEPDLWGRIRNTVAASRIAAQGSVADLENVRLSAQAELAVEYVQLRAQDAQKQVMDTAVNAYQDALDLTRDRYVAGLESDEAVAQAEAQLTATRAQDTNLGILRAQYEHAIGVLIGEPPSRFSVAVDTRPLTPPAIPVGVPSELLERRPDIAAAERAVAQANAQVGLAQTAFFPTATLSGSAGFQAVSIAQWLTWPSRVWSVGPTIAQAIFDAGLRKATVQQYRAAYDRTVVTYRQTVLVAFQEVEDNLVALRILAQVIDEQGAAVESARRNLQLADVRYGAGVDPYLNVIVAQTALLNAQQTAVAFRSQQLVASVQLVRALGGGWNASQLQ
ncbi:MAG TPA: efflux transporter outer membrane subunit [Vicinamibacterales bacterium]|nr:efflux transporter outer membrane subunit [Vicinamibacterales bacterium]